MTSALKEELLNKMNSTVDENQLSLLNSEYNFFTHEKDVTDSLSPNDFNELSLLMEEPFGHDAVTMEDYKKATERWRIK